MGKLGPWFVKCLQPWDVSSDCDPSVHSVEQIQNELKAGQVLLVGGQLAPQWHLSEQPRSHVALWHKTSIQTWPGRHRSWMLLCVSASQLCCMHSCPALHTLVCTCLSLLAVHMHACPRHLAGNAAMVVFLFCHPQKVCSLSRQITWMLFSIPTADFLPRPQSIFSMLLLTKLSLYHL